MTKIVANFRSSFNSLNHKIMGIKAKILADVEGGIRFAYAVLTNNFSLSIALGLFYGCYRLLSQYNSQTGYNNPRFSHNE